MANVESAFDVPEEGLQGVGGSAVDAEEPVAGPARLRDRMWVGCICGRGR